MTEFCSENLLIMKDGTLKISDLGVAIRLTKDETLNQQLLKRTVGTPAFLPPELCAAEIPKLNGPAVDIWALGVTLYFFIFGRCPFTGDNEMQMFENIRTKEIEFPREINSDLANLLQALLMKDPEQRPTIQRIKNHSWTTTAGERNESAQST